MKLLVLVLTALPFAATLTTRRDVNTSTLEMKARCLEFCVPTFLDCSKGTTDLKTLQCAENVCIRDYPHECGACYVCDVYEKLAVDTQEEYSVDERSIVPNPESSTTGNTSRPDCPLAPYCKRQYRHCLDGLHDGVKCRQKICKEHRRDCSPCSICDGINARSLVSEPNAQVSYAPQGIGVAQVEEQSIECPSKCLSFYDACHNNIPGTSAQMCTNFMCNDSARWYGKVNCAPCDRCKA